MYTLTGTRTEQIRSCTFNKVTVKFDNKEYQNAEEIINTLKKAGYEEVEQHFNGTNTTNLFFNCRSKVKYPIGHKFHNISVIATLH